MTRTFRRVASRVRRAWIVRSVRQRYEGANAVSLLADHGRAIRFVTRCIDDAARERSKLLLSGGEAVLEIQGMSSDKGRHLLNNLCSLRKGRYLEVGVWRGATFAAAGFMNELDMHAVDNWSKFGGPRNDFLDNSRRFVGDAAKIHDNDSFAMDLSTLGGKFDLYFYDGDHSYESQRLAFTYYDTVLADTFIAVVDDYNQKAVQQGTQDAFAELHYRVLFERYLPTSRNSDAASWWDGLYVALISKASVR